MSKMSNRHAWEIKKIRSTIFILLLCSLILGDIAASEEFTEQGQTTHEVDLIDSVTVDKNELRITINKQFRKRYLLDNFFAKYDNDVDLTQLDYSIQIMPCIMNLVSIVWISGKDYYIESMDEELYHSLEKVKEVFKRMYKKTRWNGRLIPRKLVKNTFNHTFKPDEKERMALLFSGGLDSTTSSLYHRDKKQLLVTVWGHWDTPLHDRKLWETRRNQLIEFGKEYGHENTFIKSNYYSFLNRPVLDNLSREISSWRIFTVEGIGWAGLVAPLMLLKGYPELRHASTITWDYNFPAAANPFIDDNIKFSGVRLKHDLFDMNRIEKCEYIAQACKEGCPKPFVRVCEEKTVANCCHCQKCIRTIIEFVVVGENPQDYGFAIDPEVVVRKSKQFMQHHNHASGATTVWHFTHIQKKMQEREKNGLPIPENLRWILSYDLKKKITADIKNQHRINWRDFADLLPELEIPSDLGHFL